MQILINTMIYQL